ncbi:hypothetical protein FAM09_24735 [Niastella caeni]|uniref:Uncharacterized protein n=1 Tax=Niastella caeni TaxID=2569763 RepID=A0A4S8HGD8_9BACT|nr:hypothetical protein [Niastella caeni]THU34228.1 hypothetical protein FAM09_24735 [Niastella caeni]
MPAYSFKQRFVPFVEDGSKPHTIRGRRKKGFAKKGDILYHYFGLRTKWCRKLREEICTNVRTIIITATDIYLISYRISDKDVQIEEDHLNAHGKPTNGIRLDDTLRNTFAWHDGFRPEGSTRDQPGDAFNLMIQFWISTHQLPFIGDLIDWLPTEEGLKKAKCISNDKKSNQLAN